MTPLIWSWLLSLAGAAMFFSAGAALTARRHAPAPHMAANPARLDLAAAPAILPQDSPAKPPPVPTGPATPPPLAGPNSVPSIGLPPAAARRALESVKPPTASRNSEPHAALIESKARCAALVRELEGNRAELQRLNQTLESEREQSKQAELASASELEAHNAERRELIQRDATDAQTAALQHELAMNVESLRTRETQLESLREDIARLRTVEEELTRIQHELAEQVEQTRLARSRAYSGKPARKRPISDQPISTHVRALQTIVDTETRTGRAKSAVIADELGLLVAASGENLEYGDALAAMGAYLSDVGSKTRDVLPMHEVCQVVVRDDHDLTLTVRPLIADDPGLALVTLAVETRSAANTRTHNH